MTDLIIVIASLLTLLNRMLKNMDRKKMSDFMFACEKAVDLLEKAQSTEEKREAAKRLADLIHRL